MSNDPAFLFYPNDYIGGTMGMTFEEKGAYMEILMMQFNRGRMTTDMIGQTVGQLWDKIQVKFTQDDKGLWYNERLENEQTKRKNYTESRRNNASGVNQYSKKEDSETGHVSGHTEGRMEDVNRNENVDKKGKGKCLMKNSGVTIKDISEAFRKTSDLMFAEAQYYYNAALDWSDSGSNMRTDWVATIRGFARRDLKDGKLKIKKKTRIETESVKSDYGIVSPTSTTMPDDFKKSLENIGRID